MMLAKEDTDPSIGEPTLRELQRTLSSQKSTLRASWAKEDALSAKRLRRALAKADGGVQRQPAKSSSAPVLGLERNSSWATGLSYSFGKPRHRKGKNGILVCEPRDDGYAEARQGTGMRFPGVGQYEVSGSPDGLQDFATSQGQTGGWQAGEHEVFRQTLRESGYEASPQFFQLLRQRLPKVEPWRLCDHMRWCALKEHQDAQKLRRIVKWREEQISGKDPLFISAKEARERAHEEARLERLLRSVDEYEEELPPSGCRSGRPREVMMRNQQRNCDGEVLDADLTGHLQFRKSPGYTFGSSRDPKDYAAKRLTHNASVRTSSAQDTQGPGRYCGLDEQLSLMHTAPSFSLRSRVGGGPKFDKPCPDAGPGYHGPLLGPGGKLSWRRQELDLRATQTVKPSWTFGREPQRFEKASSASTPLTDKGATPDHVGPGSHLARRA